MDSFVDAFQASVGRDGRYIVFAVQSLVPTLCLWLSMVFAALFGGLTTCRGAPLPVAAILGALPVVASLPYWVLGISCGWSWGSRAFFAFGRGIGRLLTIG